MFSRMAATKLLIVFFFVLHINQNVYASPPWSEYLQMQEEACDYLPTCSPKTNRTAMPESDVSRKQCCNPCSCQDDCLLKNDCCPGKEVPDNVTVPGLQTVEYACMLFDVLQEAHSGVTGLSYWTVNKCPQLDNQLVTKNKVLCEQTSKSKSQIEELTPVYSTKTEQNYANKYCAYCNSEIDEELKSWTVTFNCTNAAVLKEHIELTKGNVTLLKDRIQSEANPNCNILFEPPSDMDPSLRLECMVTTDVLNDCNLDGVPIPDESVRYLRDGCNSYHWPYRTVTYASGRYRYMHFKNWFCFMCFIAKANANYHNSNLSKLIEDSKNCRSRGPSFVVRPISFLLNGKTASTPTRSEPLQCLDKTVYDRIQESCRPLVCPFWTDDRRCQQPPGKLRGISMAFKVRITPKEMSISKTFAKDLIESVTNKIAEDLSIQNATVSLSNGFANFSSLYDENEDTRDDDGNKQRLDFAIVFIAVTPNCATTPSLVYRDVSHIVRKTSRMEEFRNFNIEMDNRLYEERKRLNIVYSMRYRGEQLSMIPLETRFKDILRINELQFNQFDFCPQIQLSLNEFREDGQNICLQRAGNLVIGDNYYRRPSTQSTNVTSICLDLYLSAYSGGDLRSYRDSLYVIMLCIISTHFA